MGERADESLMIGARNVMTRILRLWIRGGAIQRLVRVEVKALLE